MNFISENFENYPIITNPDVTLEEVKDLFYEFIAFLTYKKNFIIETNIDLSIYCNKVYTLYDAVCVRRFSFDELLEMYSIRDINTLLYGPEYNTLVYSAKSLFITNITSFQSFTPLKERYIIENLMEIEDINIDKFIEYYHGYQDAFAIILK